MKTIPFKADKQIPYREGFTFAEAEAEAEAKHGEVSLETEGRLPDWGD